MDGRQQRVLVCDTGNVLIKNKDENLNISINNREHSSHFLNNNRQGADLIKFDVPKGFDDFVQESVPKVTDVTASGTSIKFPSPWIEWIEEYAKNVEIRKRKKCRMVL